MKVIIKNIFHKMKMKIIFVIAVMFINLNKKNQKALQKYQI